MISRWPRGPRAMMRTRPSHVVLTVIAVGGAGGVALWPQADAVIAKVPLGAQRLRSVLREAQTRGAGPSALTKVQDAARAIDRAAAETTARPAPAGGPSRRR